MISWSHEKKTLNMLWEEEGKQAIHAQATFFTFVFVMFLFYADSCKH